MIIVLMGVSGSGKTTVGQILAEQLGWTFLEGDDFHPAANIQKMRSGIALQDEDRRPWLAALQARLEIACERGENVVLACSALKDDYRDFLEAHDTACVEFVYLRGTPELIQSRLMDRKGHFMEPALLGSQFEALEPPEGEIEVNIDATPEAIVKEIRRQLGL
ncbi:MAG: gluconokinase [Planctomycetaceae bacterium]